MIKLDNNSIIYIACPANFATGGPELLHQLGLELKEMGLNVFMYYLSFNATKFDSPVHKNYIEYQLEYTLNIEDNPDNLLIISETAFELIEECIQIRTVIWWLSVDNVYVNFDFINRFYNRNSLLNRIFCKTIKILSQIPVISSVYQYYPKYKVGQLIKLSRYSERFYFWAQSFYAIDFLAKYGINNVQYVSDYLRSEFIENAQHVDASVKMDIVAYNPAKGFHFTQQIIQTSAGSVNFIPIVNMSPQEVRDLLFKSKVYIDFGSHPGKDRIPREAAMLGCCVITSLNGSAKFDEDVPIPMSYKFADEVSEIPNILMKIKYIFTNYNKCSSDFSRYKTCILDEEQAFKNQVKQLFG